MMKTIITALLIISAMTIYAQDDVYGGTKKLKDELSKMMADTAFASGANYAKINFKDYKGASSSTMLVSILTGPVIGLVPAFVSTANNPIPPAFPVNERFKEQGYYNGYVETAKHIKSRKVWGNWAIGSVISVGVTVGIIAILTSKNKTHSANTAIPQF
jgi:hypothetical protein